MWQKYSLVIADEQVCFRFTISLWVYRTAAPFLKEHDTQVVKICICAPFYSGVSIKPK